MSDERKKRMAELTAELGRLQREETAEFKEMIKQRIIKAIDGLSDEGLKEFRFQVQEHVSRQLFDADDE